MIDKNTRRVFNKFLYMNDNFYLQVFLILLILRVVAKEEKDDHRGNLDDFLCDFFSDFEKINEIDEITLAGFINIFRNIRSFNKEVLDFLIQQKFVKLRFQQAREKMIIDDLAHSTPGFNIKENNDIIVNIPDFYDQYTYIITKKGCQFLDVFRNSELIQSYEDIRR